MAPIGQLAPALGSTVLVIATTCAWSHALATWLPGNAPALLTAGIWAAGQMGIASPWAAWLPPAFDVAGPSAAEIARVTLLVAALTAVGTAGIDRRRA